ncbi:hypothetical protein NEOLEDRAFT_1044227, partial [Neolentinus lepideus HHB14362 ss-1]
CLKGQYLKDKFFADILKDQSKYTKMFVFENELVYIKTDKNPKVLCIPDIQIGARKIREILINHAHSILAHLGGQKTLAYLRENVWW